MLPSISGLLVFLCAWVVAAEGSADGLPGWPKVFDFAVSWGESAPADIKRNMLLVNGQSPGPVIEVDQGDEVVLRVHNHSPFNTSVHLHGVEMHGTPWSDGVPGVTQRPIDPGHTFTYKFQATQYGSYWYHAHFRGQIEDGMYGAIVIHPRKDEQKPFHLISDDKKGVKEMEKAERNVHPLLIADLTHLTSQEKWETTVESETEISCYDAVVFNGQGRVECIPEDEVEAHLNDAQKAYLGAVEGAKMTDKACLPASVAATYGGNTGKPGKMREGVFEGCRPTEGSVETVEIDKSACDAGAWVAFDFIGAVNFMTMAVSIDEHDMWVYAMDGSYIEPQKVQSLTVTNGDRYSVLVKPKRAGDFKIRANANSVPQMITGYAVLSVKEHGTSNDRESKPYIDLVGQPLYDSVVAFDQNTAKPYPPAPVPKHADDFYLLSMDWSGSSYLWNLNSSRLMPGDISTRPDLPTLFDPKPYVSNNVTISTRNNTWIDLVFLADAPMMPPHPIHKHGVKMYQIGAGTGPFQWNSVNEAIEGKPELFNLEDPPRRDTFASPPTQEDVAWMAVRYHVSDPGPWLLHCHINTHMEGGMMMVIQDGVDVWPTVPDEYMPTEQRGAHGLVVNPTKQD